MVEQKQRKAGSIAEFEDDWRYVLESEDDRFFIFPSKKSQRQVDLLEWIKAQQIERLLNQAQINSGRVLEYGCGAAGISLYLSQRDYEAHLCDLSFNALRVAEENRKRHAPDTQVTSTCVANVLDLPYRDGSFEVVMSFGLLEHFEMDSLHRLITESIRILKPGGLFIADIVPGLKRYNARTLSQVINFLGSATLRLLQGRWRELRWLNLEYFDQYFETTFDDRAWATMLSEMGLKNVRVDVCRPFPILALSGRTEQLYADLIGRALRFHQRFDGANTWFTRHWGWMYLSSGTKEESY